MKEIGLLLITLAAFVAIYCWTHFEMKEWGSRAGRSAGSWVDWLNTRFPFWRKSDQKTADLELPELSRNSTQFNFENDVESERSPELKPEDIQETNERSHHLDSVALSGEEVDRSVLKRRQLEKLKELADKAKSVSLPPPHRKRPSRSQAQGDRSDQVGQDGLDWRIQSKLNCIERAIKARRGDCFLASIPEALASRDSFTN